MSELTHNIYISNITTNICIYASAPMKIILFFGEDGFKGLPCHVQDHVFFQGKKSMVAIHRPFILYAHYTIPVSSLYESRNQRLVRESVYCVYFSFNFLSLVFKHFKTNIVLNIQ